ncbi:hypothetical protein D9613_011172 [Agrocybe pediades]|uniref:F-box domain-containing protein n=1 Tax=Agrocybe pediades TaxID=84607 RepID=A0A8H4VK69_9AGAR|nr:hypothetical protein D9613_011172 [Agrocybe pediades]
MTAASSVPKTINSLPKEILALIFEEVFAASRDIELDSPEQLKDPTLFPYCIAGVCRAWKGIVHSIPGLLTRIVLRIDEPICMKELRDQLKLSKGYSINFYVVRESYEDTGDESEKPIAQVLMQALIPHITRCKVVVFDLLYSTSLPRIRDFRGNATELRTLRMRSRHYTGSYTSSALSSSTSLSTSRKKFGVFTCRNLQYLDLDGHVFMEAVQIPGWDASLRTRYQKHLTISNLTTSQFDLRDFLNALSQMDHLASLKLVDVDLDSSSCVGNDLISIFIQNFHFIGLRREFVASFFANHANTIDVSSLILDQCELTEVPYLAVWRLSLENIAQEEDVSSIIKHWDGIELKLRRCPGLNDKDIDLLTEFQPPQMANFYAPTLRQLEISACGPVSVKAINNLVYMRDAESKVHDSTVDEGPGLNMFSVFVYDTDVPISKEDYTWLTKAVENFTWCMKCPPPAEDSPILDWDCSQMDLSQLDELPAFALDSTPPEPQSSQLSDSPVLSDDYALLDWAEVDLP